jgi:fluoroquinolone transport system permease protein
VTIFFLPVLEVLGMMELKFFYLLPGKAGLLLMEGAFNSLTPYQWMYAVSLLFIYILVAYRLAYNAFYTHIKLRIGG